MTSVGDPMLQAALAYAELGYSVLPCAPGRKTPLTKHGLLEATTDRDQITRWWSEHPDANIAIRTDGLVVIDIDGEGNAWLAEEPTKLAELAQAPTSLTPRGGRHHFFRQPTGRSGLRNSVSRLAPNVDTRASGGYVLVAPSVVDSKPYQWAEGLALCVAPSQLLEPPAWLLSALEQTQSTPAAAIAGEEGKIRESRRNKALTRLAGWMRRGGLSPAEILAALNKINIDRCDPPLDSREVAKVANSIGRYAPDEITKAMLEGRLDQDHDEDNEPPHISVAELLARYILLPEPVIYGLLRRGETMNVIAPPKTGKSWLALGLAMCVATGRQWLGRFDTVAGRVLLIDNELRPAVLANRIPRVAESLGIGLDEISQQIDVASMRGRLRNILSLAPYFQSLQESGYSLVVLDAMYRFMPKGVDENDNSAVAEVYNYIDSYSEQLNCAFVLIHHTTKGNQSGKSVTDVGAGAGSQSRAADTHLVLRPHQEPGAVVLEAATRSWQPVAPAVLRWEFPVFRPAADLPVTLLQECKRPKT